MITNLFILFTVLAITGLAMFAIFISLCLSLFRRKYHGYPYRLVWSLFLWNPLLTLIVFYWNNYHSRTLLGGDGGCLGIWLVQLFFYYHRAHCKIKPFLSRVFLWCASCVLFQCGVTYKRLMQYLMQFLSHAPQASRIQLKKDDSHVVRLIFSSYRTPT